MEANEGVTLPIPLKIKLLYDDAQVPERKSEEAAGFDCYCHTTTLVCEGSVYEIGLGFAMEIPKGYVGLLFPRSSIYTHGHLVMSNCVGVIDSDYRGEVMAHFNAGMIGYNPGERCCQLIIIKLPTVELIEVTTLSSTTRGIGGHGSTGV